MDRPELPAARQKEFRRLLFRRPLLGSDKLPNVPSRGECLKAIHLGLSNDKHDLRELKDLTNVVDRWARAQADGSQLAPATQSELTTLFNAVHSAWRFAQYMRYEPFTCIVRLTSEFQANAQAFLEYARDNILPEEANLERKQLSAEEKRRIVEENFQETYENGKGEPIAKRKQMCRNSVSKALDYLGYDKYEKSGIMSFYGNIVESMIINEIFEEIYENRKREPIAKRMQMCRNSVLVKL